MSEAEPSDVPVDSSPDEHQVVMEKENDVEHDDHLDFMNRNLTFEEPKYDATNMAQEDLVKNSTPSTELEIALYGVLDRKNTQIDRLGAEIIKLKSFVQKRKQVYKRKRRDDGAPRRALSGYNIFIKERFAELQKENDKALKSDDSNAELKRVPPANLVSKTGNEWKALPAHVKKQYDERYVSCL
jgi:CHAT domain-containing protein